MLVKIIILLVIVGSIYLLGRTHARRARSATIVNDTLMAQTLSLPVKTRLLLFAAVLALPLLMAWFVYDSWRTDHQLVKVSVIDIRTGQRAHYLAQRNDIQFRSFQDTTGRRILLADQERMEIEPAP